MTFRFALCRLAIPILLVAAGVAPAQDMPRLPKRAGRPGEIVFLPFERLPAPTTVDVLPANAEVPNRRIMQLLGETELIPARPSEEESEPKPTVPATQDLLYKPESVKAPSAVARDRWAKRPVRMEVWLVEMDSAAAAKMGFQRPPGHGMPLLLDNGEIGSTLRTLHRAGYVTSLAEPNLTALNGETATFICGGQVPVPVVTSATAAGLQAVTFVPYGVSLRMTPVVTHEDCLRLRINAQMSTGDPRIGTRVGAAQAIELSASSLETTVEMRDGQTFALGGIGTNGTKTTVLLVTPLMLGARARR